MKTNVNAGRDEILWAGLLKLCHSCGLEVRAPDDEGRFGFWRDGKQVIHQAKVYKGDHFKTSGYFNGIFGKGGEDWRGQPITSSGQVRVIETIDPNAPMAKNSQPAFIEVVEFVLNR
jgi:hypothetical protein